MSSRPYILSIVYLVSAFSRGARHAVASLVVVLRKINSIINQEVNGVFVVIKPP
jgi:hypothetical protein